MSKWTKRNEHEMPDGQMLCLMQFNETWAVGPMPVELADHIIATQEALEEATELLDYTSGTVARLAMGLTGTEGVRRLWAPDWMKRYDAFLSRIAALKK